MPDKAAASLALQALKSGDVDRASQLVERQIARLRFYECKVRNDHVKSFEERVRRQVVTTISPQIARILAPEHRLEDGKTYFGVLIAYSTASEIVQRFLVDSDLLARAESADSLLTSVWFLVGNSTERYVGLDRDLMTAKLTTFISSARDQGALPDNLWFQKGGITTRRQWLNEMARVMEANREFLELLGPLREHLIDTEMSLSEEALKAILKNGHCSKVLTEAKGA